MPSWPTRPIRPGPGVWMVAAVLAVTGCSGSGARPGTPTPSPAPPGTRVGIPDPDEIAPARLAPLKGLQPCQSDRPTARNVGMDDDLPLPPAAEVTVGDVSDTLQSAQGFSPRTPVEIMVEYLRTDGWEVLQAEDEVFESEVLLDDGHRRLFVKSQAVCSRGSAFVLFASTDAALVPTPAGTP